MTLSAQIDFLTTRAMPEPDLGPGAVYPHYAGRSLLNLPASICRLLGVPAFGAPALDDALLARLGGNYRHVLLILVDGLGWVLDRWCIAGIEEKKGTFLADGAPRRIDFRLELVSYGRDLPWPSL